MVECVKCGHPNREGTDNCEGCSWPFNQAGWTKTKIKINRVTIDTNCINVKRHSKEMNILEKWKDEGKIIIQRSDALLDDLKNADLTNPHALPQMEKAESMPAQPGGWYLGLSGFSEMGDTTYLGGPDMQVIINKILFPTTKNLTASQANDVQHLHLHVLTGGDVSVTKNSQDFIERGKQQILMNFGIWVFSPTELINFLIALYGWDAERRYEN